MKKRQERQSTPEFKQQQHDRYYGTPEQQEAKKNAQKTDKAKARRKAYNQLPERKLANCERNKKRAKTPEFKAKRREKRKNPEVRKRINDAKRRLYAKNPEHYRELGRIRYVQNIDQIRARIRSPIYKLRKNKQARDRGFKKSSERLRDNPGAHISRVLCNRLGHIFRKAGSQCTSLRTMTDFVDNNDLLVHFEGQLKPGMRVWNYGSFWSIGHNIPLFWYDKEDPEDLKRANMKANLGCDYVMNANGESSNCSKAIHLPPDEELLKQSQSSWPKSWRGVLPSNEYREAKLRCRWPRKY